MSLAGLEVDDLRCLQRSELNLHPRVNLIVGANGSGKTSLLEAIYLLGRGRSFRTRHTERLIRLGAERLNVLGRLEGGSSDDFGGIGGARVVGVGCERSSGAVQARIDRRDAESLAELSTTLPVQVLDPGIHRLVEEGPSYRRKWLDWGVFHVEHGFVGRWANYSRVLKQRNAALQQAQPLAPWDAELAKQGEALSEARSRALDTVRPFWTQTVAALLEKEVSLGYFRGWSQEQSLAESLAAHVDRDRERGLTQYGPHRFDVTLKVEGRPARDVLSRGQQKLLGAAMSLAMAKLVSSGERQPAMLLLDDPAAELDAEHTAALVREIHSLKGQMVITALRLDQHEFGSPDRMFHVEQGRVKEL
jgi:DNA replication and repair protein RecF